MIPKKPYKMRRRPAPLTTAQQALASEAWGYVADLAARAERRCPATCASAEVACRIVRTIGTYDPSRSSLKSWAFRQARGAILDAQRSSFPAGARRHTKAPPTQRLDICGEDDHPVAPDDREAVDEEDAIRHLLRGLLPREREIVRATVIDGEPLSVVADRLGCTDSQVCRLRAGALERLGYAASNFNHMRTQ